ncbi:hypothetical protein HNY73_003068 [Argiope bruennichi]|uniref:Uncharacterized protein n=1 Tax=Argiope bruennichi TaxID=94029 RepID=A0A8T0FVS1_ARGBR|nr:hypothetical protein HNY73_003068 [Argiope bruennichi]
MMCQVFFLATQHICNHQHPQIESPSKKRQRLEQVQIERSIIESLNSKQNYDSKTAFTNFNELKKCIEDHTFSSFWTSIEKNENVIHPPIC